MYLLSWNIVQKMLIISISLLKVSGAEYLKIFHGYHQLGTKCALVLKQLLIEHILLNGIKMLHYRVHSGN